MTNEFIAIELVKAWCMQPSTSCSCFTMNEVLKNYEKALKKVEEIRKDESVNDLVSCEEESEEDCEGLSEEGTDDFEKKVKRIKFNFKDGNWKEIKEKLEKGV